MDTLKRKESPVKLKKKEPTKRKIKKSDVKKPTSAYLYFVSDYRKVLKKKGKEINKVQEVAKLCGIAWKSMTEEEKAPYTAKYATDKARFLKEKEAEDKKSGKEMKDPTKPKRPQSGYFLFLADFRKEMAGKTLEGGEKIPTLAGEKWRDMPSQDKKKYDQMVEQDKQRYEKEMDEWKKTHPDPPKFKKPQVKKKQVVLAVDKPEVPEESSDEDDDDEDSEDDSDEDEKSDSNDSDSE